MVAYRDDAHGVLRLAADDGGEFTDIVLTPEVTVATTAMLAALPGLQRQVHEHCFIARSLRCPVRVEPSGRAPGS